MIWYSSTDLIGGLRRNGGSKTYLQILADLNCCEVYHIEAELKRLGCVKEKGKWLPPKVEPAAIIARPEWKSQQSKFTGSILEHSIFVQITTNSICEENINNGGEV